LDKLWYNSFSHLILLWHNYLVFVWLYLFYKNKSFFCRVQCYNSWQCTMFLSGRMFLYVNTNIVLIYSLILVWLVANLLPRQWIVLIVSIMTLDHCWQTLLSYPRLIGRLLYLTSTRRHIVYVTQQLSQFIPHPTKPH